MQKRNQLSVHSVQQKSNKIKEKLFSLEIFHTASSILFYVSYGKEVFTHDMIRECLSMEKTVIVPKVIPQTHTLLLSRLHQWSDLKKGSYGILEPEESSIQQIDSRSIDIIIVPGVAFDRNKNRIGHGKGYYDILLPKLENIPTIALAFDFQIVEYIDSEDHDIPIDMLITEERILI